MIKKTLLIIFSLKCIGSYAKLFAKNSRERPLSVSQYLIVSWSISSRCDHFLYIPGCSFTSALTVRSTLSFLKVLNFLQVECPTKASYNLTISSSVVIE